MNKMQQQPRTLAADEDTCNAIGCFKAATQTIKLRVGNKGMISLQVCDGCVLKFNDNVHEKKTGQKGATGSGQAC